MVEEEKLLYLGFMLSKNGDIMQNINHRRNNSIGTGKKIIRLIEPLGPYTFECGLIYIKSLIRNSILYASETMYHVKEKHYWAIEAVEESVLRKILQTKRSSPRHFLYLETGLVPARHQIHRQVINYLKYIIDQPNTSLLVRVFESMRNHPKKGDWASWALNLIEKYELNMTLEEIKETEGNIFKNMVKR